MKKTPVKKWLKIFISLCITVLALWLSFRRIEWNTLKESFLQVNIYWVILALGNTILTVYALGWRWQILLKPKEKIPLNKLFRLNIISQYINIIVPGRFGEPCRAYLVSKHHQVSGGYVTGTIAIEKFLDFFIFVFLWVSIPFLYSLEKEVKGPRIALFFCLLSLSLFALLIWSPKTALKWAVYFSRFLPNKLRQIFLDFFKKGIDAFSILKNLKRLIVVSLFTFGLIIGQVLTNYFLFKAFDLQLSFWVALFLLLAIQVGSIPPSVPGKIGIFEYIIILALSLFNVPKSQALCIGIILHIVTYLPRIILGLIFFVNLDFSLKKAAKPLEIKYD